jgi:hypothetical protein
MNGRKPDRSRFKPRVLSLCGFALVCVSVLHLNRKTNADQCIVVETDCVENMSMMTLNFTKVYYADDMH